MEFLPAHKSYQLVPTQGFRTFIKRGREWYEPFAGQQRGRSVEEKMHISANGLELESTDRANGLAVRVSYFILPNEAFAALVRRVSIRNLDDAPKYLEVLDGMPALLPYGLTDDGYKKVGHTLRSWMDVCNLERGVPFYRLRSSTDDSTEVTEIEGGHFYLSFAYDGREEQLLRPIVDPELIFGYDRSFRTPSGFLDAPWEELAARPQITANKVPCGFSGIGRTWEGGERLDIHTMIGYVGRMDVLHRSVEPLASHSYVLAKRKEADDLADELTRYAFTRTAHPLFDAYCRQSYLDNLLRGGHPLLLNGGRRTFVYHVYSRKHGDLERDYNFFELECRYYSQGNGNYRDANQNRRNELFFHPQVKDFNIRLFASLIQPDGYNPLVIQGSRFLLDPEFPLAAYADEQSRPKLVSFFANPYTPGELLTWIEDRNIALTVAPEELLERALGASEQYVEAEPGEGYWIDHWTYLMDLIDNYRAIYPDQMERLLFEDGAYPYYDNPDIVLPRSQKVVWTGERARPFEAVRRCEEKQRRLERRKSAPRWVRDRHGEGRVFKSRLYEKLFVLALIKFATIDAEGIGIEMEANKPGWNDSLNGLPGLFGSGFSELCELKRLLQFLLETGRLGPGFVELPAEAAELLGDVARLLEAYHRSAPSPERDFRYWDQASSAREAYRERTRFGFDGALKRIPRQEAERRLKQFIAKVDQGVDKARAIGKGLFPTYFYYEAVKVERVSDEAGRPVANERNQPFVKVTEFRRVDLPYFLEGPTRAMKIQDSVERKRELHRKVKASEMYDRPLKMYKMNASLRQQSHEIGRARAFTPGWLENESIFMHMEYKYLLELLQGELYDEFFEEFRAALVPFMDPEVYGRSTLENSSFIASSANPDPTLHGSGFAARLSGSTAEFLSMWNAMLWGKRPFVLEDGRLCLRFRPALPDWMFDGANTLQARFLGSCDVTYHNPERRNTYGPQSAGIVGMTIALESGRTAQIRGATLGEEWAIPVRERKVRCIDIFMSSEGREGRAEHGEQ